jgi:hypothetical protein
LIKSRRLIDDPHLNLVCGFEIMHSATLCPC